MSDVININFFDEKKRSKIKEKIEGKIRDGLAWANDNKEIVIALTPVVIGGVTTVTKFVIKRSNMHKEETLKNLYCYDRSLGHYWRLRRELSNKEWLEIDNRKKNGERLADILAELKVLK